MGLIKKKQPARKSMRPEAMYEASGHPTIFNRGRVRAPGSATEARGFI
jgi:hypothetical protein